MRFNSKIKIDDIPGLRGWMLEADHLYLPEKIQAIQSEFMLSKSDVQEVFKQLIDEVLE